MIKEIIIYLHLLTALVLGAVNLTMHLVKKPVAHVSVHHAAPTDLLTTSTISNSAPRSLHQTSSNKILGKYEILGIDLSQWDGKVDWPELKRTGIKFVFTKATQGKQFIDPTFHYNWEGSESVGLVRGAYHFYQPGIAPDSQATHFLHTVQYNKGDLAPVLDIEISGRKSPRELGEEIRIWLQMVDSALGCKPIIYTDPGFWNDHVKGDFSEYPLWLAEWEKKSEPNTPLGWESWHFWQYSASGKVKGVPAEKVDLDCFVGELADLKGILLQ